MIKQVGCLLCVLTLPLISESGPYVGGLMGYGVVNFNPELSFSIPAASITQATLNFDLMAEDFIITPVLGYHWEWKRFQLETELQAFWTSLVMEAHDLDPSSFTTLSLEQEYVWLIRPGYQLFSAAPLKVYANLGIAWANFTAETDPNGMHALNFDNHAWGYKAGFGFSYDITSHFTTRIDYIFSQYETIANNALQDLGAPDLTMVHADIYSSQSQYLIGITYQW